MLLLDMARAILLKKMKRTLDLAIAKETNSMLLRTCATSTRMLTSRPSFLTDSFPAPPTSFKSLPEVVVGAFSGSVEVKVSKSVVMTAVAGPRSFMRSGGGVRVNRKYCRARI